MSSDFVYLASGSPRRRELLQQIGVSFRLVGTSVDETARSAENAAAYVLRLASAKADAGWQTSGGNTFVYVNTTGAAVSVGAANMEIELEGSVSVASGNVLHH